MLMPEQGPQQPARMSKQQNGPAASCNGKLQPSCCHVIMILIGYHNLLCGGGACRYHTVLCKDAERCNETSASLLTQSSSCARCRSARATPVLTVLLLPRLLQQLCRQCCAQLMLGSQCHSHHHSSSRGSCKQPSLHLQLPEAAMRVVVQPGAA